MARVVIVDDAKFMRITLANMLTQAGHEIIGEADNGREAVKQYQSLSPDIVTMDITMPVMNGIEATREIIESDKDAKIIVCSAMGQQKVVMEAIEAGAKDFIVKPFDETRVLDTISRILG